MNAKINHVSTSKKAILVSIENTIVKAGIKFKQNLNGWLFLEEETEMIKGDVIEFPVGTQFKIEESISETGTVFKQLKFV
jgi:hypothetical protein